MCFCAFLSLLKVRFLCFFLLKTFFKKIKMLWYPQLLYYSIFPTHVFSCEYCKIFKKYSLIVEHLQWQLLNSVKKKNLIQVLFCEISKILRTFFLQNNLSGCFWSLTYVFKGVPNENRCKCQWSIPDSAEKSVCCGKHQHVSDKFTKGGNSWFFLSFKTF